MSYEELFEVSEHKEYTYEDYMSSQPIRDGLEIRNFFEDMNKEGETA